MVRSGVMEWVEHDEVEEATLPEWAREPGELVEGRARLVGGGVVLRSGSRGSAVPWAQLFTVACADGRGFLLAPRRPPSAPWYEVSPAIAEGVGSTLAARRAARAGGYRGPSTRSQAPSPQAILRRVLARDDLPGAIEVPLAIPRPSKFPFALGTAIGTLLGAQFGLMNLGDLWFVSALIGVAGGLASGGALYTSMWRRYARRPRILVMTPHAFVAGLDGGAVRAIPWERVGCFRAGTVAGTAIEVVDVDGALVARTEARLFGMHRDVLIALAEAYRARAMLEMGPAPAAGASR